MTEVLEEITVILGKNLEEFDAGKKLKKDEMQTVLHDLTFAIHELFKAILNKNDEIELDENIKENITGYFT